MVLANCRGDLISLIERPRAGSIAEQIQKHCFYLLAAARVAFGLFVYLCCLVVDAALRNSRVLIVFTRVVLRSSNDW